MKTWLLLALLLTPDEQVRWLAEHSVAVRSIDPADQDFSDLQPLKQAIGKARVVQLGEATHGDGATFLAKSRLIRFLHQEMGFDVLAWEAGFFDMKLVDAALRTGQTPADAANLGLYGIWKVNEVARTFHYVQGSLTTDRPILTVGFDCRVSTPAARAEFFPRMIAAFFSKLDPGLISKKEFEELTAMSVGLVPADYYNKPGLRQYNRELPKRLVETIDRRRDELLVLYPPHEIDWVRQSLVSLMAMDRGLGPGDRQPFEDGYTRDQAMAENLLWWVNGPLKDRKVIVWAHNYHVMNAHYLRTGPGGPMGRYLKDALGTDLYTIGFNSFGGTFTGDEDKPAAVQPGELETLLHAVGRPSIFLDLSRLPSDHWLRDRRTGSFYFHEPQPSNWPRIFDGVFFIDQQKPSTPW